ncbi:hypothetical protein I901_gp32 [Pelagibacter phage HTVC011P]|uniref:Internal virion protein B n=1 Tax=Pelagibacter phage HTVC011P TaxID=1283078 RepID=M1ID80_9CAUD|nr:hypothetical protein I901_gp32 [Pelagibacter phage HTVC011P]AGE60564.1 hypothetical protein [Pelagibacter phage HTVC011P]
MCVEPTTAMMIASAGSQVMNYQNQKQVQKNQYNAQIRQNEIAKNNAIQRYASEQLKINQQVKATQQKGYEANLKSKKARSEFVADVSGSGLAMSGSTESLMRDFYRVEGNYMSSLNTNLDIDIAQYERNLEAIQFGQEAQSTYVQPPNPELLFVSSALNVANSYYSLEAQKELKGLKTNQEKRTYNTSGKTYNSPK